MKKRCICLMLALAMMLGCVGCSTKPQNQEGDTNKDEVLENKVIKVGWYTAWYEDPDYREETVVRSLHDGTILDRFPGDVRIMPNGKKWLVR